MAYNGGHKRPIKMMSTVLMCKKAMAVLDRKLDIKVLEIIRITLFQTENKKICPKLNFYEQ